MWHYLLFVSLFAIAIADPVPFITKCNARDVKCLTNTTNAAIPIFAAGFPEYGVETLDPLFFETIDSSSLNIKLIMYNTTVKGLKNCKARTVQRDVVNSKLFIKIECNVTLNGLYVMSGRLLLIPIEGKGKNHADINRFITSFNVTLKDVQGKDGKKHWSIKGWSYTYELEDQSHVRLENLFGGNKVLAKAAEIVVAANGNGIIREIGSPVINTLVVKLADAIQTFFHAVPLEDLILQ
ncbi:juvenile hormone-binding protein-like [Ostrinia furnacalis]|uniref:juvenile hormone-binding protein-like n=1 Tax=Ostrinia furnacalis TaxID=93504 RepID=UPI001040B6DB|nr:juvenile hormone-binding protein-like [Ostrinia furnacalis]